MKISFITTIFNEEKTIVKFLDSLHSQSKLPDEIIIVDGKSTDKTVDRIKNYESRIKRKKITVKVIIKQGNRSVGRNEAIRNATGDIIVCSDAGNILDPDWIKNIIKPFKNQKIDVVAGFYKGKAKNIFQKCLIPYALVMPDKVDSETFLPATRSIAFTKKIWKKVGFFDETLSHNEDYIFANKLRKEGAKIAFAQDAIVNWIPRKSYKDAFVMFFRFALGDAEATMWRTSVLLLFVRYFFGFYFLSLSFLYKSFIPLSIIIILFILYILWSIKKNYRYVNNVKAFSILPLLQLTADVAVLSGTILGVLKRITKFNYFSSIKRNKFLSLIVGVYFFLTLVTLQWGTPNHYHPFPYHMDEWHQLQAVANTFRYGTPNTAGSANGTMFHFILSGLYLGPFTLLHIIDPFSLQIDNSMMRERIFVLLRFQTIFFGVLSMITLYKIAGMIKVSKNLSLILFTFTPTWLMLSGYFKYDIALLFWIVLAIYFYLRFAEKPTRRNFLLAAIPSGLAVAVKVSGGPLLLLYLFVFFWFNSLWKQHLRTLVFGILLFGAIVVIFGMPDTLIGKGNIYDYLYENIIVAPKDMSNFIFGTHPLVYLFSRHYPIIFGHGLVALFAMACFIFFSKLIKLTKKEIRKTYKNEIFLFTGFFIFLLSLLPLQIWGGGNRSLVLLPFIVCIICIVFKKTLSFKKLRVWGALFLTVTILIQLFESVAWILIKTTQSPQQAASVWIQKNIPTKEKIGIENVPIYQLMPDIIQKEFYFDQYGVPQTNPHQYQLVDSRVKVLPSLLVISNSDAENSYFHETPKKLLMQKITQEGYKEIIRFEPRYGMYKFFGTEMDYYFSWLIASPVNISVFEK